MCMMDRVKQSLLLVLVVLASCREQKVQLPPMFEILDSSKTGLLFTNKLKPTQEFNMFKYMYFYNGAGAAAGDFNNDGWIDLFMSANQGDNKLYLNKKGLQFT
eukprot:Opistho-1_new@77642